MIIFGAHVQKDGISNNFFLFYENSDFSEFFFFFFFFWGGGLKGKKIINKCQKEILRCATSSSHVCDFYSMYFL